MGNNDVWVAKDNAGDTLRQTKKVVMHGWWKPEEAEKTGDSGDQNDNGKLDKGKTMIPGSTTKF